MQSIKHWLAELGLEQYGPAFESNDIDMQVLPTLTDADLQELGVTLGHRKRMRLALQSSQAPMELPTALASAPPIESITAEGERRQVTVLFCDLAGSTALSNHLDPEDYRWIMSRYHETVVAAVQRFDGFVQQLQGDGVVAYFGYPIAHEHEADRAIRAALAIVDAMAQLDVGSAQRLQTRIGVASGLVVVSHVLAKDKAAVGETPNLAQRMQTVAEPGEIVVSERTKNLASGAFEYEDGGTHALKGIPGLQRVWKVMGLSAAASRFEAAARAGLTPLVGRKQEIGLLLDRWELAQAGEGQVILLQGEPGIGKSRMLQAFRERVGKKSEIATLQYQCSPYYTNSALYPIAHHLERALRFERDDTVEQKLDKIEQYLLTTAPDAIASAQAATIARSRTDCSLLAKMLSIPCDDRYGPLQISPQRQKDDTVRLLVDLVAEISRRQATAILFEDAHWADPTTLEMLGTLIDRTETLPLLVLVTHRPEFAPPWRAKQQVKPISLARLSRSQSMNLVLGVAGSKPLPPDLVSQIVDKADGVPLFLEELTKAVLESGVLSDQGDRYEYTRNAERLALPSTLHDLFMARLDCLIPVKEIAQIGACFGREFSYELLRSVSRMNDSHLSDALRKLVASELVFQRGTPPAATYTFKHALVQDAAYDSLLKSKRQKLHAQIAEAIREQLPLTTETEPELLAHHYSEARMPGTAILYWQRAGELAQKRVALQEAIRHYERGLEMVSELAPCPERDTWELQLRALAGMAWVELHGYTHPQVEARLEPALRLDQTLVGAGAYTLRILWGCGCSVCARGKWRNHLFGPNVC